MSTTKEVYYHGIVDRTSDDFGSDLADTLIDGKTVFGPWALMTPANWEKYGIKRFGTGFGQKYQKQADGRWLKVEG